MKHGSIGSFAVMACILVRSSMALAQPAPAPPPHASVPLEPPATHEAEPIINSFSELPPEQQTFPRLSTESLEDLLANERGPQSLPPVPLSELQHPRAWLDYQGGTFILRSFDDNLIMVPGFRMQIDTYAFAGEGVRDYHRGNGTGLKLNINFRRFIIEFGGLIQKKWFWWVGGNFSQVSLDRDQNVVANAAFYDGFIGYSWTPNARVYVGQYNAPFVMENVTSSRWMDFQERALTARAFGAPYNKTDGVLLWQNSKNDMFEYQGGVFMNTGTNGTRINLSGLPTGMLRMLMRPLINVVKSDIKHLHIGVSGRANRYNPRYDWFDAPNLTTPGNYTFWSSSYNTGTPDETRIVPDAWQGAVDAELYIPFKRWDIKGEFLYMNESRREILESDRAAGAGQHSLRGGRFWGESGYAQVSFWLAGTPRINGNPASLYGIVRLPPKGYTPIAIYGLQLALRAEAASMNYDSDSRFGSTKGARDANTNHVKVNAYQVVMNYWATRHIRLTAAYSLYQFPGTGKETNQALAPGAANPATGPGYRPQATLLSEISFRVGLAL